jgi:hypothetical protein
MVMQGSLQPDAVIASQRVGAKVPPDDNLREAIHSLDIVVMDCFVASLLAMTKK